MKIIAEGKEILYAMKMFLTERELDLLISGADFLSKKGVNIEERDLWAQIQKAALELITHDE